MIEKLSNLKLNPNNPRFIRDEKFFKLKQSIVQFPEMLSLREIIVDEDMVILGGNMRYRALIELGITETEIKIAKGLTEEQKKEFIIKDNVAFGEWDFDVLANEWNREDLKDWGVDIFTPNNPDLGAFFDEDGRPKVDSHSVVLHYTQEEFNQVIEAFKKHEGTREQVVYKLLGL